MEYLNSIFNTELQAFMFQVLWALVIMAVTLIMGNSLSKMLRRMMERQRVDPAFILLAYHTTRWGIIILGTATALRQVNFELTAFLAGLGIVGFTIGFALQDISSNITAGMLLLVQKPFELGDFVQIDSYSGEVKSIDLRSTEILTHDGKIILLPNGTVFTSPITNFSRHPLRRVELTVGISYNSDLEMVRHATLQAIRSIPDVLTDPPPTFFYHTFNAYSIDYTVRFWVDARVTQVGSAKDPAIVAIHKLYKEKGIDIPYPIQMEIGQG